LKTFGINDLSTLKFVSDRGSNFVKALRDYSSYFCFAHRLNNILVLCFYQNDSVKAQTGVSSAAATDTLFSSEGPLGYFGANGDSDELSLIDTSKTMLKDLPHCAREVLRVLNNCKEIVKYVKLVSERRNGETNVYLSFPFRRPD
jgi:hypothetical protein